MRGEDGRFAKQPNSLHPLPVCVKLPTEVRDWLKDKGTDFLRELLVKTWEVQAQADSSSKKNSNLRITQHGMAIVQVNTFSSITCPKCTCDQFKVFLNKQDELKQLQCTLCEHVFFI